LKGCSSYSSKDSRRRRCRRCQPFTSQAENRSARLPRTPTGPLVAEVVRTTSDPFIGRLSLVRVFSGTLSPDTPLHVCGHLQKFAPHHVDAHPDHDSDDRVGPLSAPLGDENRAKPYAIAGDLVLVSKLASAETTDTLSSKAKPALVEPWVLPEPLLPVALHTTSRGDEEKLDRRCNDWWPRTSRCGWSTMPRPTSW
jgi:translation elongation factor EF-G